MFNFILQSTHKNIILNGQIDFSNEQQREAYFVSMLKDFPKVTNTYFSMADGREYGARKENNSTFAAGNWEISLDVIGQGRHPVV